MGELYFIITAYIYIYIYTHCKTSDLMDTQKNNFDLCPAKLKKKKFHKKINFLAATC